MSRSDRWQLEDVQAVLARQAARRGRPLFTAGPVAPETPPELILEKGLQERLRLLALQQGWQYYHTHDSRRSVPGWPDTALARPGELVMAELKKGPQEKPSADQLRWLQILATVPGVECYVWRPADWLAIVARLSRPAPQGNWTVQLFS